MSNEEARNMKDTRGRPRNEDMRRVVGQIEKAYMCNNLPLTFPSDSPKKLSKQIYHSAYFREMVAEVGDHFRILTKDGMVTVCLRRK